MNIVDQMIIKNCQRLEELGYKRQKAFNAGEMNLINYNIEIKNITDLVKDAYSYSEDCKTEGIDSALFISGFVESGEIKADLEDFE